MAARLQNLLNSPIRVFWCCLAFVAISLLGSGCALTLYGLHRDKALILNQIQKTRIKISDIDRALKQAQDPKYIQRQALDRFELAESEDLVFVFSDEE